MATEIIYNAKTGETTRATLSDARVASITTSSSQDWASLRTQRDSKLAETDWWASSDLTMSDAQKDYRKALRDLQDNTSDPKSPTWPSKPT